jgi:hypothetical protein
MENWLKEQAELKKDEAANAEWNARMQRLAENAKRDSIQ